jgi:flagellar basal-body rod protein FlgG
MLRSLYTASSGMKGNQLYMDTISNNLSNVNTTGYKKVRLEFQDLLYQTLEEPGGIHSNGQSKPGGIQVGLGVAPATTQRVFTTGSMLPTGNQTDVAINGDGFFQIRTPNGELRYTREGAFKVSADGYLVNSQGYLLDPPVQLPNASENLANGGVNIGPNGQVLVQRPGQDVFEEVGQLEMARFINPGGLKAVGGNLFAWTEAAGEPITGKPGENGMGDIASGYVEASNVQMVEEMIAMIVAQRAYEISSKAITTSDQMLQTANQLKN